MAKLVQKFTGPDRMEKANQRLELEKAKTQKDGWVHDDGHKAKVFIDVPGPEGPVT